METYEFDDPEKFREFMETPKRRNKYNAKKVTADGYTFDSMSEHRRYLYLKSRNEAGEFIEFEIHPKFKIADGYTDPITGKRKLAVYYVADFSYLPKDGKFTIEDVKGGKATQTPLFRLKWHLMHLEYWYADLRIIES
jgi:hypothetical protein